MKKNSTSNVHTEPFVSQGKLREDVRAHLWISGLVQGVFFRAYTKEKADELNLSGWVRNIPTAQVEVVIEGDKGIVEEMIQWCHQGPPSARVDAVEVKWETPAGIQGFTIR